MFFKIGVLQNVVNSTRKHLCWSPVTPVASVAASDDSGIIANSKIKEVIEEDKTNIPPHSAYRFYGFDTLTHTAIIHSIVITWRLSPWS